jgi:lipoprotein-releasing system ATP-binding protein
MAPPLLAIEGLSKAYLTGGRRLAVLQEVSLEIAAGEMVALTGPSGAGKSTFLHLVGALDAPTAGRILFEGRDLASLEEDDLARFRNESVGFVFQSHHLLPEFTALENVSFPLMIGGVAKKEAFGRALAMLREVGLEDKAHSRPSQLSGGEQQRVAIARALVNGPSLLLADEPTGNLDWRTGERVLRLILDLHERKGLSSLLVTHNEKIARYCHRVYMMEAGTMELLTSLPS